MPKPVEIGELTTYLGIELNKQLEKVLNYLSARTDMHVFYIRVHAGWANEKIAGFKMLRNRIQILDYLPPPVRNTLVLKFDNRNGRIEILHALPADLSHRPQTVPMSGKLVPDLIDASGN